MTASQVPPLIPRAGAGVRSVAGPGHRPGPPLPVVGPGPGGDRHAGTVYALSAVDKSGRVADRSIIGVLGWLPGTRLDVRERAGVIVAGPAGDGVCRVDDRGHLILPLAVRRWCRLVAGDRVLLAADPSRGVLLAYPVGVLDRLLGGGPGGGDVP